MQKKSLEYLFPFSSSTTWVILSWNSFCLPLLGTWQSGLDKISTKIQGLPPPTAIFKDLQGVCESCLYWYLYSLLFGILSVRISLKFLHRSFLLSNLYWGKIHTWNTPWAVTALYICIYSVPRSLNQFLGIPFFG